ncbi:hypothetical protein HDU84_000924 [Entophlyctis sp. JEL0112]|nr:hypothetical protein HDU84_000924 [Entophlyctis sp. JEL0112]
MSNTPAPAVAFSLKRRGGSDATVPAPVRSAAFQDHALDGDDAGDARAKRLQQLPVSEIVHGVHVVAGSDGIQDPLAPKPLRVIPLKLRNEWSTPETTASTPETSTATPPAPTLQTTGPQPPSRVLPSVLTARAGTKWGLQLQSKSSSASSLVTSDSNAASPSSTLPKSEDTNGEAQQPSTLQERAIAQLLAESSAPRTNVMPILQQNAVPGISDIDDPKEKYLHDVRMRPDEATLEDFELVPIEEFGIAMLRGMGYRDDDDANKKKDDFVFHKPRPNLLGLGAEVPKTPKIKESKGKTASRNSKDELSNDKSFGSSNSRIIDDFAPGTRVKILKEGKYFDQTGKITASKAKSDGIALKVAVKGHRDEMRCWSEDVEIV